MIRSLSLLRLPAVLFFFLAGILNGCAHAPVVTAYQFKDEILKIQNGDGAVEELPYRMLFSEGASVESVYPLVIVFHGTGMNGGRYLDQWKEEVIRHQMIGAAPLRQRHYRNEADDLKGFFQLLEQIKAKYPVDSKRVYLAGVSSGALIARWLMVQHPELWAGVVLIASGPYEDWMSQAPVPRLPPVLYVHGQKDPGFPVAMIQEKAAKLRELGGSVSLMVDPEAGHEHRTEWNEQIFEWMQGRSR